MVRTMSWRPRIHSSSRGTAIVGAGLMGRWHLHAARRAGAKVVQVIDRDLGAARRLASRVPGCVASETFEPGRELDAVHLCTPGATHLELGLRVLDSGAHLLVEKPLAATADDVDQLLRKADAGKLYVCPVHQYAFQNGVSADYLVRRVGDVRRIDIDIRTAGAQSAFVGRDDEVIGEILPHVISVLQVALQIPDLSPGAWRVLHPSAGEVFYSGQAAGVIVSVGISTSSRPTAFRLRVSGRRGSVEIDGFHGYALHLGGSVSRLRKLAGPFARSGAEFAVASLNLAERTMRCEFAYPGLQALVRAFYQHIWVGGPPPISFETIRQGALARDILIQRLTPAGVLGELR